MKQKLLAFLLAVLLLSALPLSAYADAYIPPDEPVDSYDILTAHESNGTCKTLNTYLSNFVEMGLETYYLDTPDQQVIACVLKHIELNAGYYHGDVTKVTGDDGKTYMALTTEIFEQRMQRLFGRDIPAEVCPGFEDGHILVTADHYGGPIQVFASVNACYEVGPDQYDVYFDVYFIHTDFSGWYTTANRNLPLDNLTHRGTGNAIIQYAGGETEESISTSDFSLIEFHMDAWGIAGAGDNVPYNEVEETEPPETEAPTEPETEAPTEPETEAPTVPFRDEKDDMDDMDDTEAPQTEAGLSANMILVIILVAAVVLLALVLLFFIRIQKKT